MGIDDYDNDGLTQLMVAAKNGQYDEVKRLLDLGSDPDVTDNVFCTTKAENFAERKAKISKEHKEIFDLLVSSNPYSIQLTKQAAMQPLQISPLSKTTVQKNTVEHENISELDLEYLNGDEDIDLVEGDVPLSDTTARVHVEGMEETVLQKHLRRQSQFEKLSFSIRKNSDEIHNEIKKEIEDTSIALRSALKRNSDFQMQQIKNDWGDLEAIVEQRKKLAKDLELSKKIWFIYDRLFRYYNEEDFEKTGFGNKLDILEVSCEDKKKYVTFRLGAKKFCFEIGGERYSSMPDDDCEMAEFTVFDEDESMILKFDIEQYSDWYSDWEARDISAFILGDWVGEFVCCYEKLKAHIDLGYKMKRYSKENMEKLKKDYGL